jgi:mono/diheme cytochrome c family protein
MRWKPIAVLGFTLSLHAADYNTTASSAQQLRIGRDLFRENCAVCHDIDKDKAHSRKIGPSLNHLFKNEKLPLSRGKPTQPYVAIRIKFGGALMPAFGKKLNEEQIATLVDYIASK